MRSSDTEVFFQSASQRDAAINMRQPSEFKILQQDFPGEISGVPLQTRIEGVRDSNNYVIIREIETVKGVRILGLSISRIRKLHDGKEVQRSKKNGRNRGSIVVSLPPKAIQTETV